MPSIESYSSLSLSLSIEAYVLTIFLDRILLRNMASDSRDDENFQLGKTDEFVIEINKEIGQLLKIK